MRTLCDSLRIHWGKHPEINSQFLYIDAKLNGNWIPGRLSIGELYVWEENVSCNAFHFPSVKEESGQLILEGAVEDLWSARLSLRLEDEHTGRFALDRSFTRLGPTARIALEQTLLIDNGGWWPGNHLTFPGFSQDGNVDRRDSVPHPKPVPGFAVQADRLNYPAAIYQDPDFSYALGTAGLRPIVSKEISSEDFYSISVRPMASLLRLAVRYPQEEYGQEGTGPGEVWQEGKSYLQEPKVLFTKINTGEQIQDRIYFWISPHRNEADSLESAIEEFYSKKDLIE